MIRNHIILAEDIILLVIIPGNNDRYCVRVIPGIFSLMAGINVIQCVRECHFDLPNGGVAQVISQKIRVEDKRPDMR